MVTIFEKFSVGNWMGNSLYGHQRTNPLIDWRTLMNRKVDSKGCNVSSFIHGSFSVVLAIQHEKTFRKHLLTSYLNEKRKKNIPQCYSSDKYKIGLDFIIITIVIDAYIFESASYSHTKKIISRLRIKSKVTRLYEQPILNFIFH